MPHSAQPIDPLGAFMNYPEVDVSHAASGPLAGLTMAVKDLFDVKGYPTGCGHPDILAKAQPAAQHAPVVAALLDAGAEFSGKTLTDEIAFSLNGINHHFGAPVNPKAPDRISGGSSSGSVSAVAAGIVDFALGTDTGGSVRGPSSHCGVFGLRPTHGRITLEGCMTLAPSFDTCGWFARDMDTYQAVGNILLDPAGAKPITDAAPMVVSDLLEDMDDGPRTAFLEAIDRLSEIFGGIGSIELSGGKLDEWFVAGRTCQASDIWDTMGSWIERDDPLFGPGVRERIEWARGLTEEDRANAGRKRKEIRSRVHEMTAKHGFLVLPTMPGVAPLKADGIEKIEMFRNRALKTLCISGLAGVPQISLPIAEHNGIPFGVSLMGAPGTDEALIKMGKTIENVCGVKP